jgi:hypothetical protein
MPLLADATLRNGTVPGDDLGHFVRLESIDHGIRRAAHAGGVFGDRIEHRPELGRRTADGPQDLAGCRLLVYGLGQCSSEAFDLGFQICVRLGGRACPWEGIAALLAELRLRLVLVLAPGTAHTQRLPSPDRS